MAMASTQSAMIRKAHKASGSCFNTILTHEKRHINGYLDSFSVDLKMVDATAPEPVAEVLEMLARQAGSKNTE
jgi:hypothetical protein